MNKDYLKIFLVPLIIILCMLLKPIYIHIFGDEITLTCTAKYYFDTYTDTVYPDFDITNTVKNPDIFDESVLNYNYNGKSIEAYAVLEKNNDYHDIKYITLNKPNNNELYLKCLVSDYFISGVTNSGITRFDVTQVHDISNNIEIIFFDIENNFRYEKSDIYFTNDGRACIKFKIKNSNILKSNII